MCYQIDFSNCPCNDCQHFEQCKTKLQACEQYVQFIDGRVPITGAKEPSFKCFDVAERGYHRHGVNYDEYRRKKQEEELAILHESSTGLECDPIFYSLMREWNVIWATILNKTVGALAYELTGTSAIIQMLYVRDHYKGHGVGSELLRRVEAKADFVSLAPDFNAIGWYEHQGYRHYVGGSYGKQTNNVGSHPACN